MLVVVKTGGGVRELTGAGEDSLFSSRTTNTPFKSHYPHISCHEERGQMLEEREEEGKEGGEEEVSWPQSAMSAEESEMSVREYLEGLGRGECAARVIQAMPSLSTDHTSWVNELQAMELEGELDTFLDALPTIRFDVLRVLRIQRLHTFL